MTSVFFTSDTHFHHRFVAGLRGFDTAEEHDEELVRRWNTTVRPDDTVWHLGDVGMGPLRVFSETLDRLNGTLHLVYGNHDQVSSIHRDGYKHQPAWAQYFASQQAYARRRMDGLEVMLSHYPYPGQEGSDHTVTERYTEYRLPDTGRHLLHGHTHQPHINTAPRMTSVGVDAWGLAPVEIGRLIAAMKLGRDA